MNARACRVGVCCWALFGWCLAAVSADEPPRPETQVVRPVSREVTDYNDFLGRAEASKHVELRARASGYVTAVHFKEGDLVKAGDVLFEIDPRPYQALLEQALSQVAVARASVQIARLAVTRDEALAQKGIVSREQLAQNQAVMEEANAKAKAAEAAAELSKLNLGYCRVVAPIDGRIGRSQIDPGNLVNQDQTLLAEIVHADPIYVYFHVDERTILSMRRAQQSVVNMPLAIGLADEEGHPHTGKVDFAEPRIESGMLRVRAVLANKENLLTPGMSIRVRMTRGAPREALVVDERVIRSVGGEHSVLVLVGDDKIEQRRVQLGTGRVEGFREVTGGLTEEDRLPVPMRANRGAPRPSVRLVVPNEATPKPQKAPDSDS